MILKRIVLTNVIGEPYLKEIDSGDGCSYQIFKINIYETYLRIFFIIRILELRTDWMLYVVSLLLSNKLTQNRKIVKIGSNSYIKPSYAAITFKEQS